VSYVEHTYRDVEDWFVFSIECRNDQMSASLLNMETLIEARIGPSLRLQNIRCLWTSSARHDSRDNSRSIVRRK
jgi:hypothetical protein